MPVVSDAEARPSSPAFSPGLSNGPRRGEYALISVIEDIPGGSDGRVSMYNAGDLGLIIPGSGRSPGEGNNPLQYSSWRIPWTEEAGGLESIGSQRVGNY